jgi:hypothetical protein
VAGCLPGLPGGQRTALGLKVETATGAPPGRPVHDDEEWHLALFHVHTTEGAWRHRSLAGAQGQSAYDPGHARMVVRLAAARGVTVVFITDHNSLEARFDRGLHDYAREVGVTVVTGTEWSLGGPLTVDGLPVTPGAGGPHLVLVGYAAGKAAEAIIPADTRRGGNHALLREVTQATHARGGAVVLAHPDAINFDYPHDGPVGFDLVEVDGPRIERPWRALARWQRWLMAGHRVGAISACDWHVGQFQDNPFEHVNLVRAPRRTPEALVAALRAGHVMVVSRARKLPRVLLGVDGDGDGLHDDVREGDTFHPPAGDTRARFQVRVVGGAGHSLVLFGAASDRPVFRERLSSPEVVRALSVPLSPEGTTFIRAELWDGSRRAVLTNPLWLGPSTPGAVRSAGEAPAPVLPWLDGPTPDLVPVIRAVPAPVDAGPPDAVPGVSP